MGQKLSSPEWCQVVTVMIQGQDLDHKSVLDWTGCQIGGLDAKQPSASLET